MSIKISLLNKLPNQKGIALVETIAALGLAIVVITSLVSLSVFTLRTSTKGKLLLEASKVASDQIELVRAYRDDPARTWADFITAVGSCTEISQCHMLADISGAIPSLSVVSSIGNINDANGNLVSTYWFSVTDEIIESGDTSSVDVTDPVIQVKVTVQWRSGSQDQTTTIYTDISNWRNN